jgi:hypothetical protein
VPLAHGGEYARLAVVVIVAAAALLGLDVGVDRIGDGLVRAACLVLVDQGGALRADASAMPLPRKARPVRAGLGTGGH